MLDWLVSFLRVFLVAVAALYVVVGACMYLFQRNFLYVPSRERTLPESLGLDAVEEIELKTSDGETLVAWHHQAPPGARTLLYFHGNGGNLAGRIERVRAYRDFGFGLLMLSYRGYSGSSGSPSETANVADARLAYDWLRSKDVAARDIVLFGESLGTGVAVQLGATAEIGGMILDAPYTSMTDAAAGHYPWLPVRLLLSDRYDSLSRIGRVRAPLLIIHGARDQIIPLAHGQTMFAAANEPKRLQVYPEAGHIYHSEFGSLELVRDFVRGLE